MPATAAPNLGCSATSANNYGYRAALTRLHAFQEVDVYPTLKYRIGDRIDAAAIREGWDEALRVGVSIEDRVVVPSIVLKKLAALKQTRCRARCVRLAGSSEPCS
jgi:TnpA family transposase